METTQDPRAEELLSVRDVLRICPVPQATWHAWVRAGTAPKGLRISPRKTLWKKADVLAFMASRVEA